MFQTFAGYSHTNTLHSVHCTHPVHTAPVSTTLQPSCQAGHPGEPPEEGQGGGRQEGQEGQGGGRTPCHRCVRLPALPQLQDGHQHLRGTKSMGKVLDNFIRSMGKVSGNYQVHTKKRVNVLESIRKVWWNKLESTKKVSLKYWKSIEVTKKYHKIGQNFQNAKTSKYNSK